MDEKISERQREVIEKILDEQIAKTDAEKLRTFLNQNI